MAADFPINKVHIVVDKDAFSEKYEVFSVETDDEYFKYGASILDAPVTEKNVRAVLFERGRRFYVLMEKNIDNYYRLLKAVSKTEGKDKATPRPCPIEELSEHIVAQLLLNALCDYPGRYFAVNNLSGRCFISSPKWNARWESADGKSFDAQRHCLELRIREHGTLAFSIRTFTNIRLKNSMEFAGNRPFSSYPQYVPAARFSLRRRQEGDTGDIFILHQLKNNGRWKRRFLGLTSEGSFDSSRAGMLYSVLSSYNETYAGISSLEFERVKEIGRLSPDGRFVRLNNERLHALLAQHPVRLIDKCLTEESDGLCKEVIGAIENKKDGYGVRVATGKVFKKGSLNLCLIHEDTFYEAERDPHDHIPAGVSVQHLTIENFPGKSSDPKDATFKAAVRGLLLGALIKYDLIDGRISLFDWPSLGLDGDVRFCIERERNKVLYCYVMTVHPDGSFAVEEVPLTLFTQNDYRRYTDIFDDTRRNKECHVEGIVEDSSGNINAIYDTDLVALPESPLIKELLGRGETFSHGKEGRDKMLPGVTDIHSFELDGVYHYFVGAVGYTMRLSVQSAANIRKVIPVNGSELFFDRLLPLMEVLFVRNNQLTVLPFPFKYLREYIAMEEQGR